MLSSPLEEPFEERARATNPRDHRYERESPAHDVPSTEHDGVPAGGDARQRPSERCKRYPVGLTEQDQNRPSGLHRSALVGATGGAGTDDAQFGQPRPEQL